MPYVQFKQDDCWANGHRVTMLHENGEEEFLGFLKRKPGTHGGWYVDEQLHQRCRFSDTQEYRLLRLAKAEITDRIDVIDTIDTATRMRDELTFTAWKLSPETDKLGTMGILIGGQEIGYISKIETPFPAKTRSGREYTELEHTFQVYLGPWGDKIPIMWRSSRLDWIIQHLGKNLEALCDLKARGFRTQQPTRGMTEEEVQDEKEADPEFDPTFGIERKETED